MSLMNRTIDSISLGKSLLKIYNPESMNFLLWLNHFEHIVDFVHLQNNMKVTFLLTSMNPVAQSKIILKVVPVNPLNLQYEVLISHLEELYGLYRGEWASNYRFLMRDQFIGESVEQYINALLKLRCKVSPFLKSSRSLKIRFINGLKDLETRNELRTMTNLRLVTVVAVAAQRESNKLSNTTN
ncbi:hypothetical protein M0804_013243 [Polistes exclamans]|nr:hypothetical protein M0804_013243 [Polistes exclamans]